MDFLQKNLKLESETLKKVKKNEILSRKSSEIFSNLHFFAEKLEIPLNFLQTHKKEEKFLLKTQLITNDDKECENTLKKTKPRCDYFNKNKENLLKNDK